MDNLRLMIRLARPYFLLGGILLYALGGGIAHYLGVTINWNVYLLGQLWVTLLQLSTQFLNEYYNAAADVDNPNRTPFSGGSGVLGPGKLPPRTALTAGMATLAALAPVTVLMMATGGLSPVAVFIMVLAFLGAFFYSTPPVRLESTGYGELTTSILVAFLVPAFAYVLQADDLHRVVAMVATPLAFIHMAMLITFELPDYFTDLKHDKRTLSVRMGWQRAMNLHNLLIVGAYLLLGIALWVGLPSSIVLPAMFTIPLGIFQIWQIQRIQAGTKPNWMGLTLTGLATFAGMAYLLAFAFWTH
jgi:1,4-dihydroxy-2-naphthoate octaprenyltransferase